MKEKVDYHGGVAAALFPLLILCAGVAIHTMGQLNHDVGFLAWGARQLIDGAVIGKDIVEVNFPLAFLIYIPPALLSETIPFPLAIRLWIVALTLIAIFLAWKDVPRHYRLAIFSTLAAYVALAWPREFAQREQIAMLLVFAYVVPGERRGLRAITIGALAGIGFAIKPHFLLAWIVIEIGRKAFRVEQLALICTGAIYAISLVTVFHDFTFESMPVALSMYGATYRTYASSLVVTPVLTAIASLALALAAKDKLAKSMAMAAVGFALAAALQFRYYNYHFVAGYGFSLLAISASLCSPQRIWRWMAALLLLVSIYFQAPAVSMWWSDREGRMALAPHFLAKLDGAKNFIVIGVHPYPAFPTAIYAEEQGIRFVGVSCCSSFLPAAVAGDIQGAKLARDQLHRELLREPDVVIVDRDWRRHTNIPQEFDGLAWFLEDPDIAREWQAYRLTDVIGPFQFFKRHTMIEKNAFPLQMGLNEPEAPDEMLEEEN